MTEDMLIGHSLSGCVGNILDDEVSYHRVMRIDSGTCIGNIADLMSVMISYDEMAWRDHNYGAALAIVERLLFDGKLHQVRLQGGKKVLGRGIWTKPTNEDIAWWNHLHPTENYDSMEGVMTGIVDGMKRVVAGKEL